jgi:hypothetical protein
MRIIVMNDKRTWDASTLTRGAKPQAGWIRDFLRKKRSLCAIYHAQCVRIDGGFAGHS